MNSSMSNWFKSAEIIDKEDMEWFLPQYEDLDDIYTE
jgi:hypothetical protein